MIKFNLNLIRAAYRTAPSLLFRDAIDAMLEKGTPFTPQGNDLNRDERILLLDLFRQARIR